LGPRQASSSEGATRESHEPPNAEMGLIRRILILVEIIFNDFEVGLHRRQCDRQKIRCPEDGFGNAIVAYPNGIQELGSRKMGDPRPRVRESGVPFWPKRTDGRARRDRGGRKSRANSKAIRPPSYGRKRRKELPAAIEDRKQSRRARRPFLVKGASR